MRFPEFSGEWENKILKSVLKCHDNFRIPLSDKQRKNMKGQYAYYGANGIIDFIDKFIFNGNYILLAEDGGKFDEFRTKPIAHKASGKFWVNNHAHVLSTNNILDFVFYQLEHKDIRSFINIGSRSKLNKNDMFNIIISLCSLKEQSKIANFLSLIDKRIELQNKIIRDYKLLKKLMNDRLIYKNENKVMLPLNEFATLKNGYAFKGNINFKDGKYSVITITNVTGDRLCNIKNINKVNHLPLDIQKHQILKSTDILISLTGNVGRVSYCGINNGLLNQRVGLLEIFDKQKVEYIFQALSNKEFEKRMISLAQGGSQLNLSKNDIEKYKIPLVSDVEANKISNLLMRYDLKILLGKNSLSNYKKVKKFLLMQLFI